MKKLYRFYVPSADYCEIDFFDEKEKAEFKKEFPDVQFTEYVIDKTRKGIYNREEVNGVMMCSQELYNDIVECYQLTKD